MPLTWSFFPESDVDVEREREFRALLVAAFPRHASFFATTSYRGSVPEYRLIARDAAGALVAHLECGPRIARVGHERVSILGIGAVAVHPLAQGQGIGRSMFQSLRTYAKQYRLADFGFLECSEAVAGFYERAGFVRLQQPCTSVHYETGELETYGGPVMVLPVQKPIASWPSAVQLN